MSKAQVGLSTGSYVRFHNVTDNHKNMNQDFDTFEFMPCKSKLLLQRGPSGADHLLDLQDSAAMDQDVQDIYVSGQDNYRKVFDSKVVSRSHAMVRWHPTQHQPMLTDLGSTHGTYLTRFGQSVELDSMLGMIKSIKEGKKLESQMPTALQNGDVIQLGKNISRGDVEFTPLKLFVSTEH